MGFRILLGAAALAMWGVVGWLATYVSALPTVLGRWSPSYAVFLAAAALVALLLSLAQIGPAMRRLRPARGRIAIVLVSILVSLGLVEGLVRLLDPHGISYYEAGAAYHRDKIPDPELVYRHRADCEREYGGIHHAFNELGLRDRPIGDKGPGELRVLLLGDSVAFGWGVEFDDTVGRQLEDLLAGRLGRPVRTINSGVGSYNSVQQLAFLRRHVDELDPDVVLLLYASNDVEPALERFDPSSGRAMPWGDPPQAVQRILGTSWLYRLAVHALVHGRVPTLAPPVRDDGWHASMDAVADLASTCQQRGAPFAVALWRLAPSRLTDGLHDDLAEAAAQGGFTFVDLAGAFDGLEVGAITNSPVDVHPNAAGHATAARWIDAELARAGVLPR